MARVLVTGANGFLGSWVVRRLIQEGNHVFPLIRKSSNLSELDGIVADYRYGDVTDLHSLLDAFHGIDTVFHLAGLIAYKKSERTRMENINVGGTANVLEACRANSVRKLVYLSSVVAVGASFTPDHILNEDSEYNLSDLNMGYFETKRKAEHLVKEACDKNRVDAVMLNPSTIYGPGDAKKGSRKTQVKVARGEFPFYTSGGVNVVSVHDAVDGILSAWKKGRTGERYILAGENILIKDLFAIIARCAGERPPTLELPTSALHAMGIFGDILATVGLPSSISRENAWSSTLYHWFDSSKAQSELDFKPRPAEMAIAESVEWMRTHGLLNKKDTSSIG
ncbi:MAG: dihydroflavonol 4-reductase [Bdellovibrio sp. CG10_big_fil_rev_8_21_14_0_10_47_8]|nr:MAG: dihydroflavonol 4-reductase [Bdellovibrio sp. CG10_big_fil_rev_8_21_14_0_10_47_8]